MPIENNRTLDRITVQSRFNLNGEVDFFVLNWRQNEVNLAFEYLRKKYEMRLDLFAFEKLGNTRYLDLIMYINDILNPFSVKEGQLVFFPRKGTEESFAYIDPKLISNNRDNFLREIERSQPDANRREYLRNNQNRNRVPPTVSPGNSNKIQVQNNRIKLAPNLFTNPNQQNVIRDSVPQPDATIGRDQETQLANSGQDGQSQPTRIVVQNNRPTRVQDGTSESQEERILVDRFIRRSGGNSSDQT